MFYSNNSYRHNYDLVFVSVSCLFLTYFLNSTEKRAITANSAIFLIKLQVGDSANLIEKQRDFSSLSLTKMKERIVLSYYKQAIIKQEIYNIYWQLIRLI